MLGAAAQGLVAGINAVFRAKDADDEFVLKRSEAYIGVLVDDLVNKSTEEPYRMFTSRAEYRLLLRQDNADRRLMERGAKFGLIPVDLVDRLREKERLIRRTIEEADRVSFSPNEVNSLLASQGCDILAETDRLSRILRRPNSALAGLLELESVRHNAFFAGLRAMPDARLRNEVLEQVEIELRYEGYISRQTEEVERFEQSEAILIPPDFDYARLKALSAEGREKLRRVQPSSIGQAARISGVTPADVSILMVYLRG